MKNKKKTMLQKKKKRQNKIYKKLHCCKRVFYEIWELYDNSLGDSHFQTYVMNNIEIVFIFYLHITL